MISLLSYRIKMYRSPPIDQGNRISSGSESVGNLQKKVVESERGEESGWKGEHVLKSPPFLTHARQLQISCTGIQRNPRVVHACRVRGEHGTHLACA